MIGLVYFVLGVLLGWLGTWFFYRRSKNDAIKILKEIETLKFYYQQMKKSAENEGNVELQNSADKSIQSLLNFDTLRETLLLGGRNIFSEVRVIKDYINQYKKDLELLKKYSNLPQEQYDKLKRMLEEIRGKSSK